MTRICSIILWATTWFWVSCTSYPRIPAGGEVAGKPIITTVDSNLAKYYLENALGGGGENPRLNNQVAGIDGRYRTAALKRQTFKTVLTNYLTEFAALFPIK